MRILLLAIVALVACETSPPPLCPGSHVATFRFTAARSTASSGTTPCSIDGISEQLKFVAALAWDPGGTSAAICVQRPYGQPSLGTHTDDQVTVQNTSEGNVVFGCGRDCGVTILETVDGHVNRNNDREPTDFSGELRNVLSSVSPSDGASCSCQLPCEVTYTLDGVRE